MKVLCKRVSISVFEAERKLPGYYRTGGIIMTLCVSSHCIWRDAYVCIIVPVVNTGIDVCICISLRLLEAVIL